MIIMYINMLPIKSLMSCSLGDCTYYVGLNCAALEAEEDRFEFSGGGKFKPVNMT